MTPVASAPDSHHRRRRLPPLKLRVVCRRAFDFAAFQYARPAARVAADLLSPRAISPRTIDRKVEGFMIAPRGFPLRNRSTLLAILPIAISNIEPLPLPVNLTMIAQRNALEKNRTAQQKRPAIVSQSKWQTVDDETN